MADDPYRLKPGDRITSTVVSDFDLQGREASRSWIVTKAIEDLRRAHGSGDLVIFAVPSMKGRSAQEAIQAQLDPAD